VSHVEVEYVMSERRACRLLDSCDRRIGIEQDDTNGMQGYQRI
jgi:hypothetical protein